ncbi:MAG: cyclic pyranopterin monophosphate synthase MoaC [Acidimicrobiales bacterium]
MRDSEFTHVDERGAARIVDVSEKQSTHRRAVAKCRVMLSREAMRELEDDDVASRVFGEARIVGTMATKQTSTLIPLCHPVAINGVTINISVGGDFVEVEAVVLAFDRTGLEMEALTACAVGALCIVGEFRKFEPKPTIAALTLWEKSGGRSGNWTKVIDETSLLSG